jgi:uncharacterized protein
VVSAGVFADASALAAEYLDEPGADAIRGIETMYASVLTRCELASAFHRGVREGRLDGATATTLDSRAAAEFSSAATARVVPIDVTRKLLEFACVVLSRHRLRASDAIQLASAIAVRTGDRACTVFACHDLALRRAAVAEGFTLLPV